MNSNANLCECGVPVPRETLPSITVSTGELLMDAENILYRISCIIENHDETPRNEQKIDCFRDSLLDIRARAERVNALARSILDNFQS